MNCNIPKILKNYLDYLSTIQERANSTVKGYKLDLIMLFKFLKNEDNMDNNIDISDIDKEFIRNIELEDLYSFLAFTKINKHNNAFTRARKVATIKSFFKYCQTKIKILDENVSLELETPKLPKKQVAYLSLGESEKLLKSICGRNKERDFCIITLFLNCGLRLNELCNIKLEDIRNDILVVRGKGDKDRTIYLNESCIKAIKEYMPNRKNVKNTYLFISERGNPICKRSVQTIVKNNIKAAGLDAHKYSTHKLRHTSATLLYKYGKVDIRSLQQILGHENISTTTIYTHVDDESIRNAIKSNPLNK
ncbi:tyrosine recombinase XerC [Clostridium taeniosporum]|uniref:Tyrosine recombinase XerC n=1 Tax=Clostridium taeniosporum TaxID=394958 RepID=A0A1D7XP04_9CLOT|nr:tyrosine recombinase XerC [Clostridium taeniosporum]AOR25063.1 tyrosine recombinase XerC [Clostridium taeniosporum]